MLMGFNYTDKYVVHEETQKKLILVKVFVYLYLYHHNIYMYREREREDTSAQDSLVHILTLNSGGQ